MKTRSKATICLILLALCSYALASRAQEAPVTKGLALVGAKIYPAPFEAPIEDGVVLIAGEKIIEVGPREEVKLPPDFETIDCSGSVIMAGFWNCHVHLMEPKWQNADALPAQQLEGQLKEMLTGYGFTYAFDLATLDLANLLALRHRVTSGQVAGPTIFTAGVPFTPPAGSPFYIAPLKLPELSNGGEAVDYVIGQLAAGADAIKVWSASPNGKEVVPMPMDIIQAGCSTAHSKSKPVFAHPTNLAGVAIAANGGVDILTHVAADDRTDWSRETVSKMLSAGMALIPTLKLHKWELERAGLSAENNPLLTTALQQLRSYHEAGGQILFGTDVGYMADYSPEDEYLLMGKAGMDYLQILAALTTSPAQRFGKQNETGRVAAGMAADLVVLSADPSIDVKNFTAVKHTVHKGKVIY